MVRAEKMILRKTDEIASWLSEATAIYNQALYYLRQEYFNAQKEQRKPNYSNIDLYALLKQYDCWTLSTLDINCKQYVLRNVNANWKSFYRAIKAYWKDKSKFKAIPAIPRYLKHGRIAVLTFDKTRLRHKDKIENTFSLPKSIYKIQLPDYIDLNKIRCVTVKAYYGNVKLSISYEKDINIKKELNKDNCLGIDIGVDNIVAITTNNQTKSWIVKGGCIKSINQFYNKKLAELKSQLETVNKTKTSKRIQRLGMKRMHKLDHEFHCLSKKIIDLCLENGIGKVVIGHNKGWKQDTNLGKKTNQKFVSIPFNNLIFKIQYKAKEVGIECVVVEESYTSKVDHLAREEMKMQDNYLGQRVKRGLFKSSTGKILNADINGAIGILRKVNAISDADLVSLRDRGDVVSPRLLRYGA